MSLTKLQYRILSLSYKHKLSHLGSCLGCVGILDDIYSKRKADDPVILSCGHAGLGLYVVLEKYLRKDAEDLLLRHGVHPSKNATDGIWCSTGSLGQGLSVAVGRALADRNREVWCVISDGEMAEGVIWESLNFIREHLLDNLHVIVHWNGFGAYRKTPWIGRVHKELYDTLDVRGSDPLYLDIPFLNGLDAHYYTMTEADWKWVQSQEIL